MYPELRLALHSGLYAVVRLAQTRCLFTSTLLIALHLLIKKWFLLTFAFYLFPFALFEGPEQGDEQHDYDEDGDGQGCADFNEIEEAVATWRKDEDAGGLKRRDE